MFWVIQEDMFEENRRDDIIRTLERFGIPYQRIKLPQPNMMVPEISYDGPIITNGSVMLSKIARKRGWTPGSLLNDNFSYDVWYPHFRDHLLNHDTIFTTMGDADPQMDEFFIRPLADDKCFNGRVLTRDEFAQWRLRYPVETPILISKVKVIGQEFRHYVVDGEVVSSSRYKLAGQPSQAEVVDGRVIDYARSMARIWQPARAFVLDTYMTGDEMGIVEMGCICHAGLYQADVQKIVMALDAMEDS
jgi:hypothetical protein